MTTAEQLKVNEISQNAENRRGNARFLRKTVRISKKNRIFADKCRRQTLIAHIRNFCEPGIINIQSITMTQETIQAADFKKKPYATPEMKVYEVKARSIIATSPTTSTQNEEYGTVDTSSWF